MNVIRAQAPGRSQAGPHPLGGSFDVLVERGAHLLQKNVVASRRGCPHCAGCVQKRPQGRFMKRSGSHG